MDRRAPPKAPKRKDSHVHQATLNAQADRAEASAAHSPLPAPASFVSHAPARNPGSRTRSPTPIQRPAPSQKSLRALLADVALGKDDQKTLEEVHRMINSLDATAKQDALKELKAAKDNNQSATAGTASSSGTNKIRKGIHYKKTLKGKLDASKPSGAPGRGPGGSSNLK